MQYKSKHWREWISERFNDPTKYSIESLDNGLVYIITPSNKNLSTYIAFWFMRPDDDDVLFDIQFCGGNPETSNIWMSPFTRDPKYRPKLLDQIKSLGTRATSLIYDLDFVERLESEWLKIPLKTGWIENVKFIHDKPYYSELKYKDPLNRYCNH
ncbi:MAG: hypothetical protein P1P88_14020 [Bacteroidales bacterium]|nr:hypothetical protein [Bacteroidales bacterium]